VFAIALHVVSIPENHEATGQAAVTFLSLTVSDASGVSIRAAWE